MPNIIIDNLNELKVSLGAHDKSIIQAIHRKGIDWMHACGTKGRCTTCKMIVLQGLEHLGEDSAAEARFRAMGKLKPNERLACQCLCTGDIRIRVPEASKFPHMNYSD